MNSAEHMRGRVAAIVDGYAMGNYFHDAFARHGVQLVHVQSTPELMARLSPPDLSRYLANLPWTDEKHIAEQLAQHRPFAIIPGIETGVPVADRLNELLHLPGNGSALSTARRDKFAMIEQVRRRGLHCAEQFRSGSAADLAVWARRRGEFPVVVKPLDSASTDGVYICADAESVQRAAEQVLESATIFGKRNTQALIQSYLEGEEYIVDTVSYDGQVYVCGVWRYHKTFVGPEKKVYDRDVLVDSDTEIVRQLTRYVEGVLRALGVRFGPAHAEVMMTSAGPALVEIGARMNGGNLDVGFHQEALGHDQAELTALAFADPDRFLKRYAGRVYRKVKEAVLYQGHTTRGGVVDRIDEEVVQRMRGLPSMYLLKLSLRPGDRLLPTTDQLRIPYRAYLAGTGLGQLERDCETLRELTDHVYVVKPDMDPTAL